MRTTLIILAASSMLALPLIGNVQQVPGESTRRPSTAADLQKLMELQTKAIESLNERVVKLEARVKKLEDERGGGNPR
jgi:uncharacterized protein YlxW (UPF0749 family)